MPQRVERPWGWWEVLYELKKDNAKVKIFEVAPGKSLSTQRHMHREEVWIILRGTAKVSSPEQTGLLHSGEAACILQCHIHTVSNPGKIPLRILEIQIGEYLEEDDIERFTKD